MSSLGRLPGWQQDLLALLLLGMLLAGFAAAFLELRDTTGDLRAKADATGRSIPKVEQFIDSRQVLEELRQTLETDGSDKASLRSSLPRTMTVGSSESPCASTQPWMSPNYKACYGRSKAANRCSLSRKWQSSRRRPGVINKPATSAPIYRSR